MIADTTSIFIMMPITWILLLLMLLSSVISLFNRKYLLRLLLHPVSVVREHQYYRLLTADFVHNDPLHLLMNMVMLGFVGGKLERFLRSQGGQGSWRFALIYLGSMLAGSIVVTLMNKRDFDYMSTGASGSVLGCMFSYTILQPQVTAFFLPYLGGIKNQYDALIFILGLIYYRIRSKNELINHELHFFGALGGITMTLSLYPEVLGI